MGEHFPLAHLELVGSYGEDVEEWSACVRFNSQSLGSPLGVPDKD